MEISLDTNNELPMFAQLINQVKNGVLEGQLPPDFVMPSIRQLANDLNVNQNTVAKAYRLLERDQVIVTRGYKGTFIHENAVANCLINLNEKATLLLDKTISKLRDMGLTDSEIRIAFSSVMKKQ